MLQNKENKKNKLKICTSSCHFMRFSFIWPDNDEELSPSKWFYIKQLVITALVILPVTVSLIIHLVAALKEGSVDISEDLSILGSVIGVSLMMVIYVNKQQELALLLRDLSDFETYNKPPCFDSVNRKLNYFSTFIFLYAIFGTIVYNSIKINDIPNCKKSKRISEICGTLVPAWAPFNADSWLALSLLITYVFFFAVTVDRGELLISAQAFEVACNLKLRVDQLNLMILDCFNGDEKSIRKKMNECIRYHVKLIEYCERYNSCFTYEMFVYLVTAGTICGFLENEIMKRYHHGAALHMVAWMGSLFLSSWSGQILIDSSTAIADAAYNSHWYSASVDLKRDLIFLIMRSQKPLFLTTGPFNVLSFPLFLSIMKMSYSILTLLR